MYYLTPELERRSMRPDIVVLATEGKYLGRLVQELSTAQATLASNIFFTKEAIVCWILDEAHAPKRRYGAGYIPTHPDPIKACRYSVQGSAGPRFWLDDLPSGRA